MSSEEKTPTVSPDQGATGETTTSSENKEAHYKKAYDDAVTKLRENMPDPEANWKISISPLLEHFARENRSKRSEKPDFLNLDELKALEAEHQKTYGRVPEGLQRRMACVQEQEEFESYLKLLSETRACFGHGIDYIVILYIKKYKGKDHYQNLCMSCLHKEN